MKVLPYNMTSKSSKALATILGCKRIKRTGSRYRNRTNECIINWGRTVPHDRVPENEPNLLNRFSAVAKASNKLSCFNALSAEEVSTLAFTTDRDAAQEMLAASPTNSIYCRHKLSGKGGAGIEVIKTGEQVPEAPLYTLGLTEWSEWRLHCGIDSQGATTIILLQQKVKRDTGGQDVGQGSDIRNHESDFIFKKRDLVVPEEEQLHSVGGAALRALGLDFGAIDMAFTEEGLWRIIEVNTAAGLAGTSNEPYADFFNERQTSLLSPSPPVEPEVSPMLGVEFPDA